MAKFYVLLSTIDDEAAADRLGASLVEEGLAACVSIIPDITSVYKWEGKLERARERLLLIKTTAERRESASARLKQLHPYDVPEIISLPIESGFPEYLDWVRSMTSPSQD